MVFITISDLFLLYVGCAHMALGQRQENADLQRQAVLGMDIVGAATINVLKKVIRDTSKPCFT